MACQGSSFALLQEEAPPQEGGLKGWVIDKKTPVGGSPLALARPQWTQVKVHPHALQLTPTPPPGSEREVSKISISKTRHDKGIKVHAL